MKKLPKPTKLLDESGDVESKEDVSTAMSELAWMKAQRSAVDAEIAADVAKAKKAAEDRLKTGSVNFADRIKLLTDNVVTFARRAKASLLEGGRKNAKTAKLTHGSITFKDQVERIEVADADAFRKLTAGLEQSLSDAMKKKAMHATYAVVTDEESGDDIEEKVCVASLVNVKVSLDKAGALASWKAGLLTPEQFELFGLKWDKPDELVTVKIDENSIVSASAEAA